MNARYLLPFSLLSLGLSLCLSVPAWAVSHNPALAPQPVVILSNPASSSPIITVPIQWPFGPAPTVGTLTVTIDSGTAQICLVDASGEDMSAATRSWNAADGAFPESFQIRPKAVSSAANDVKISIQHDTGPIQSKELTVVKIIIKEVGFSADTGSNYIEVKSDSLVPYSAPHWQDNSTPLNGNATDSGDVKHSAAYIRNTKPKIAAKFEVAPSGLSNNFTVEAAGPTGFKINAGTSATLSGGLLTLDPTVSSETLPNTILYHDAA
jgi:hypothetical protein